VPDTTLAGDRTIKGSYYAAAGVQEYWIMNLVDRQIEVYQSPMPPVDGAAEYRTRIIYRGAEVITPQALPNCRIAVEQVIPKRES
jgi:Uma2 family endonuclease